MKLFVLLWVNGGLKQRKEYVLQHLGKVRNQLFCLEDVTERGKSIATMSGSYKSAIFQQIPQCVDSSPYAALTIF